VRIIRRCLEKDVRQRIQTARDVANELRDLQRQPSSTMGSVGQARTTSANVGSGAAHQDEGFRIAVLPFRYSGSNPDVAALAEGLSEEIVSGLLRFSYLRIVAPGAIGQPATERVDALGMGKEMRARYVMEGSLRQAGSQLRVAVQLLDTATGAHLWAETFNRTFDPSDVLSLQDDLVPRIVSAVGDAHGVLPRTMSEELRGKQPGELTPYEAVLRSFGYGYRYSPEEHAAVRAGLERAVEVSPGLADAWAMLSLLYAEEHASGFNTRPDPLGRALQAARRAADAAPSSALAHNALARALFFGREFLAFRTAAERAVELNPLNGPTLAGLGAMMAYAGDWERGCAQVEQAARLHPRHPGWYWFPLFYNAYRQGDYRGALAVAMKINLPQFFNAHMVLAAAYGQLEEAVPAHKAVQELLALKPDYAAIAREELGKWLDPELAEHMIDGLRKAGLDVPAAARVAVSPTPTPMTATGASRVSGSGAARADEGFWVAVLPFKLTGDNADLAALADGLSEEIVTGLSRFSYLRVIARGSTVASVKEDADARDAGKAIGARYVMEGSLRQAGTKLRLAAKLVDATTGAHLWAETYERVFSPESAFELQDDLVGRVVSTVADMHGVLPRSMSEAVRSRTPDQLSPYEAVLRSFSYFERVTAEELAAARSGLELAVVKAPTYADAWAMLALLCAQEYGQGFNLQADPLASGAIAARRAVEAGSSNHLAHFSLAQVLFFQKEFQTFRNAAARAAALNPLDGNAIAFLGELLIYSGDWERGLALAGRAKQLNPHHPGWYWYADAYNAYRQGDYRGTLDFARRVNMPGHWGGHTMIAAACGQLGEREAAGKALRDLLALRPDLASIVRQAAQKWWGAEYVEHLLDGLRKAGLEVPAADGSAP
jgi:TolB-like protein/Flp pilus assembly protein TadD